MFDLDQFIADCNTAVRADRSHKLVREVVARAVSDPTAVIAGLGEPRRAEVQKLYNSPELTILNVIWGPLMTIIPTQSLDVGSDRCLHRARGQYLLAPSKEKAGAKVEAAGAKSLGERDAEPLGCDIIHSVTNPLSRVTGTIHVYGGDFFSVSRSEWDPETLLERNYDMEKNLRLFEAANLAYANL